MNSKLFIALLGTMLLVCGGAAAGFCGGLTEVEPSLVYGACIDDYIKKCEAKADLLDSTSLNIRKVALRATVKGAYMRSNRAELIAYLKTQGAPFNPRRIEYHLNQKFARSVAPREVYAALVKEHAAR